MNSTMHAAKGSPAFLRRFYLPLALSICAALLSGFYPAVLANLKLPEGAEVSFQYGVLAAKIPAALFKDSQVLAQAVLALMSAALLAYAVNVDFSRFFPPALKLEVLYGVDGIVAAVAELKAEERRQLQIDDDWQGKVGEYDADVIDGIRQLWQKQRQPDAWPVSGRPRPDFTGKGDTTFIVERTGFLSYRIVESTGRMFYSIQTPRDGWTGFPGAAKLKPSIHNHIRPRLLEVLRNRSILIRPEFLQIFGVGSVHDGAVAPEHDHTLVAVTRITLLPLPGFGDTLYLWRGRNGLHIPIARSVNSA